ncbi:hypothetical protein HDV64DRAFT_95259 [Trichoderma sp. TUCIM 5745]
MSASDWTQKVFRLRRLPSSISSREGVVSLLSETLGLPLDHIIVYSLAKTSNQWEPMSKVATVQFKSIPSDLRTKDTEWTFPIPGSLRNEVLILNSHFEGMTVLNDVDTRNHHADCIAISGLGSHPFGSWQPHGPDKSFMWIRDELPRSVPGVRAVVYGYDSQLVGSNSFQSISDIARSLIGNLKSGGWNLPSSKPIIFLAHSLGGIVLKDAIVQIADSNDRGVTDILTNLLGAIMFGVPNLGMQQSSLMAMVEGQANEMLIQDLSRDNGSDYLRQLNKAFNGLSIIRTVKILWAYETKQSPTVIVREDGSWCKEGPSAALVNIDSATGHYHRKDKSLMIPINKDHSNMVKFSRGDNDLGKILISLKELCSLKERLGQPLFATNDASRDQQTLSGTNTDYYSTSERVWAEDEEVLVDLGSVLTSVQEIHDRLYLPELDYRISQVEDPFQNTFKWIFDLDLFTHWLQEGSGLFWIYGKPGSGKSTLMKYIFQSQVTEDLLHNWRKSSLNIKGGFFFHYRGTAMQKSFEGVLRSVIVQLLQPHRCAFQKEHQETWKRYQQLEEKRRVLESQKDSFKKKLDAIIADVDLKEKEIELQRRIKQLQADVAAVLQSISLLAKEAKPFRTQPETKFLRSIGAEFRNDSNSHIGRLERILNQLLDQDIMSIDLVLFFDALDEFDGHLEKMSGFLKSLVESSATSATRVKVCFSSRPWKSLDDHFAKYPGFRLQDHTKADIEQYATGSLARLGVINFSEVVKIIPSIIARANGVFLWVRLAVKELLNTIAENSETKLSDRFAQKLQELPTDLFEFYKLIIERISETNRRYTFALLELLIRHAGPPATATDVWGAVMTSNCTTFQECLDALESPSLGTILTASDWDRKMANDISTWGGGLVEIKARNHLQLMHQTVLEFTSDLLFKRIVMGDVAAILNENGHSFFFKYWVVKISLGRLPTANNTEPWTAAGRLDYLTRPNPNPRSAVERLPLISNEEEEQRRLVAYHAEKSESTTGISQLGFIQTLPIRDLQRLIQPTLPKCDDVIVFLTFACTYGLTLCIRDWIAQNPNTLRRMDPQPGQPSLFSFLVFEQVRGAFHDRYLAIASLLLENDYRIAHDTKFFTSLLQAIWEAETVAASNESASQTANMPAIHKLAILVLDLGQNYNIDSGLLSWSDRYNCTLLHVAPSRLAVELIRLKANVNALDSHGETPLNWVLKPPDWFPYFSLAQRYEKCCLLVKAEGSISLWTPANVWRNALTAFDNAGYDTRALRRLTAQASSDLPRRDDSEARQRKRRHCWPL